MNLTFFKQRLSHSSLVMIVFVALAFWIQWPLFWTQYLRGDEYSFFYQYHLESPWTQFWTTENQLGYGALFWFFISVLKQNFHSFAGPVFRGLLLFLYLGFAFFFSRRREEKTRWLVFFLMLASPCFWWYGKIIGVELTTALMGLWGLDLIRRRSVWGWWVLGIAVGLKPSNLVFPLFAIIAYAPDWKSIQLWGRLAIASAAGFILANPFLLSKPHRYLEILAWARKPASPGLARIITVLFEERWTYDLVFSGSFMGTFLQPLALTAALFLLVLYAPRRVTLAWLGSVSVAFFLIVTTETYYGWYWFPAYYLTVMALSEVKIKDNVATVLALILAASQTWATVPRTLDQIELRQQYIQDFNELRALSPCLETHYMDKIRQAQTWVHYTLIDHPQRTSLDANKKTFFELDAFKLLASPDKFMPIPKPILFSISDSFVARGQLAPWQDRLEEYRQKYGWQMKVLGRCGSTTIYSAE